MAGASKLTFEQTFAKCAIPKGVLSVLGRCPAEVRVNKAARSMLVTVHADSAPDAGALRQAEAAYGQSKKTLDKETKKQIKKDMAYLRKLLSTIKPASMTEEQNAELNRAREALLSSAAGILPKGEEK